MNRQKKKWLEQLALHRSESTLPEHLRAVLNEQPDLRDAWAQSNRVASLLSLKRYELPEADAEQRCRSAVIRQLRSVPATETGGRWGWLWIDATPAMRVALAALFVAMIGLHILAGGPLADHVHSEASQWTSDAMALSLDSESQVSDRVNPEFAEFMAQWMPQMQQSSIRLISYSP